MPEGGGARSEALLAEIDVGGDGGEEGGKRPPAFVVASPDGSLLAIVSPSRASVHSFVELEKGRVEPSATVLASELESGKGKGARKEEKTTTTASTSPRRRAPC